MDIILQEKSKKEKEFNSIMENKRQFNEKDLENIEKLISEDNTQQEFVLEYLKLFSKFKNVELNQKLEQFKFFLSKKIKKENFGNYFKETNSSSDIFKILYEKIKKFSPEISINDKICFYLDLIEKDFDYDSVNGIVDYNQNRELYLIILINIIKNGIEDHIKNIKELNLPQENEIIAKFKQQVEDIKIFIKIEDSILTKKEIELKKEEIIAYEKIKAIYKDKINAESALNKINKDIITFSKISSQEFDKYFDKFSDFLNVIEINFKKRFIDIENLNNKDFELFNHFCFFLTHYNFEILSIFEINKWNNSFNQTDNYIEKVLRYNSHDNINRYIIEDNDLILEIYDFKKNKLYKKIVRNIRKYSINNIVSYLSSEFYENKIDQEALFENELNSVTKDLKEGYTPQQICDKNNVIQRDKINNLSISTEIINEYSLEEFLKYDSYEEIYFNKIWNIWEDHLIKIFTSSTIKSVFEKICKLCCKNLSYYDFLNEKDLKQIFKRSRYFLFKTDFLGLTEPHFLFDYEYYRGLIPDLGESCSKLINLSMNQITKEHQILGHINIRLQKFILKKEVNFPVVDSENSLNETNKINESGEYIETLLYGRTITEMSYNEILFILDGNNYNVSYEIFKENFSKCNQSIYQPSDYLKDLLKLLNINLNIECIRLGYIKINEKLFRKIGSKLPKLFNHPTHTHLHRSKTNKEVQKIINEIYSSVLGFKGKNIK